MTDASNRGSHACPTVIKAMAAQNSTHEMAPTKRTASRSTTKPAASAVTVATAASIPKA